ncbi:hypothetical protein OH77DRAFT_211381 [Trametes cingulata]|nr:hypothetical protein OH77DRAFT_211381 [Trametes cingulata]
MRLSSNALNPGFRFPGGLMGGKVAILMGIVATVRATCAYLMHDIYRSAWPFIQVALNTATFTAFVLATEAFDQLPL